jgi:hypothetical protein
MRKLAGTADTIVAGRQTLDAYWSGPFADHLAGRGDKTQVGHTHSYAKHVEPRLGNVPLARLGLKRARRFHADLARDKVNRARPIGNRAGFPGSSYRPEQDSNLRPTP